MLRGLVLILAALLVLPGAQAGIAPYAKAEDPRGDGRTTRTDILDATLEARDEGLRFSIRMADFDDTQHIYWIILTPEGSSASFAAVLGYGSERVLRGGLTSGSDRDGAGLDGPRSILGRGDWDRAANGGLVDLSVDGDATPTYAATIPWGAYLELQPGTVLEWKVGNTLYEGRGYTGAADMAFPDGLYVAEIASPLSRMTAGALPILVPAWTMPLIVVSCVLLGAGGGFLLSRRAPAAAARAAPVATPVAVRAPPPPPGQRFRAAPPRQR